MAKITICDICGTVGKGRSPEGFHEIHEYSTSSKFASGYCDLCDTCYDEYNKMFDICENEFVEKLMNWIKERQNLKGENDVSRN